MPHRNASLQEVIHTPTFVLPFPFAGEAVRGAPEDAPDRPGRGPVGGLRVLAVRAHGQGGARLRADGGAQAAVERIVRLVLARRPTPEPPRGARLRRDTQPRLAQACLPAARLTRHPRAAVVRCPRRLQRQVGLDTASL
eukprot:1176710-Prorocentrum_minimum.AAC.1